jgi:hypothetical protein
MGQRLIRTGRRSKGKERMNRGPQIQEQIAELNSRFELVQLLIPLGLKAVGEELQTGVAQLVGHLAKRNPERLRWGGNPGSVYLWDQKVKMEAGNVSESGFELARYCGELYRWEATGRNRLGRGCVFRWEWHLIPFRSWPAIPVEFTTFGAQRRWSRIILSKVAKSGQRKWIKRILQHRLVS